jgi:hypothetical protein
MLPYPRRKEGAQGTSYGAKLEFFEKVDREVQPGQNPIGFTWHVKAVPQRGKTAASRRLDAPALRFTLR